jgi:hypothetical protein
MAERRERLQRKALAGNHRVCHQISIVEKRRSQGTSPRTPDQYNGMETPFFTFRP